MKMKFRGDIIKKFIAVVFFCSLVWGTISVGISAVEPDYSAVLSSLGIVSDKRPFASFDYLDLKNGQQTSLQKYLASKKRPLTLLVFWATWCGPCRYELPQLNELYKKFQTKLNVVAVSVDNQSDEMSVKKFIHEGGFLFDTGLDLQNSAAKLYDASAIPLIYLIDDKSRLIGKIQGARDWKSETVFEQFEKLFNLSKLSTDQLDKIKTNNSVKELPAPTVAITLKSGELLLGQEFYIDVKVSWQGSAYYYSIRPPQITLPSELKELSIGASSDSSDLNDGAGLIYRIKLKATKEGSYKLAPLLLSYGKSGDGKELFTRKDLPTVVITTNSKLIYILLIAVVIILILLMVLPILAKRRAAIGIGKSENLEENFQLKLLELKSRQIHLDSREYTIELLSLMVKIYGHYNQERPYQLAKILDEVKFASRVLSKEELNLFEVEIKNQLEKILKEKGD